MTVGGDALGLNRATGLLAAAPNAGANPSSLRRVNIINYFVDADSRLIRRAFDVKNASFVDSVIAEHLVTLQFRYVLEPSAGGAILQQPSADLPLDQTSHVRLIEPSVSIETAYALQDGQKRQLESVAQIEVRNIQFLAASVPIDAAGNSTPPNPWLDTGTDADRHADADTDLLYDRSKGGTGGGVCKPPTTVQANGKCG